MGSTGDAKCHKPEAESSPSLFQNGNIVFQAHHVGWIVSGSFTVIAIIASFWLVNKHLQWYTNKREQRYIVRLLFLVPIYAAISFASYLFWNHSTPLLLIRDAYEAIVLTAFFYLLLMYLSSDPEEQKKIFLKHGLSRENDISTKHTGEKLQKWVFPLGFIKWKPADGLFFLQLMKWGVLQYCVVRPVTTLAAVILDYAGLYCEESWGLGWGHVYIVVIISLSVTIAMYCLIQLYVAVATQLAPHKPLMKLFSVKAVVFLTFWQATFLSVLSMFGVVKDTKYMTAEDINIGIGALLETFEMMLFALLHIRAFTYKPYRPHHNPHSKNPPPARTARLRALGNVMDFRETFHEIWIGCIYLLDKVRGKEPVGDLGARRAAHYESAFGRPRSSHPDRKLGAYGSPKKTEKGMLPAVEVEVMQDVQVDIEGKKQWLGIGDNYGYGIGYLRRERSEGLQEQIERELQTRGYSVHTHERDGTVAAIEIKKQRSGGKRRSWWRSVYNRLSQADPDPDDDPNPGASFTTRRNSRRSRSRRQSHHSDTGQRLLHEMNRGLGNLPSSNAITAYEGVRGLSDDRRLTYDYIQWSGDEQHLSPLLAEDEGKTYYQQQQRQQRRATTVERAGNFGNFARSPSLLRSHLSKLPAVHETSPAVIRNILPVISSYNCSDSLLGRVFSPSSENDKLGNSSTSVLSLSSERDNPAKNTPLLATSASQVMDPGLIFKTAKEEKPVIEEVNHVSLHSPISLDIDLDDPPPGPSRFLPFDNQGSPSRSRQPSTIQHHRLAFDSSVMESPPAKLRTFTAPFLVLRNAPHSHVSSSMKAPKMPSSRHVHDDAYHAYLSPIPTVAPRGTFRSTPGSSLRTPQQSHIIPQPRGLNLSPKAPRFGYQRQSHLDPLVMGGRQDFMSTAASSSDNMCKRPNNNSSASMEHILYSDSSPHDTLSASRPARNQSSVTPGRSRHTLDNQGFS